MIRKCCCLFLLFDESNSGAARKSLITQIFPKAIFNENDPLEESITRLAQEPTDIVFILDNGHEASSELLLDLWAVKRHLYQSNRQRLVSRLLLRHCRNGVICKWLSCVNKV